MYLWLAPELVIQSASGPLVTLVPISYLCPLQYIFDVVGRATLCCLQWIFLWQKVLENALVGNVVFIDQLCDTL